MTRASERIKLTNMANRVAVTVKLLTPKRRWAQFSLVTMFAVVTMLCVVLALVVVPAKRQRHAVAAIEALGGRVHYAELDQGVSEAFPRPFLRRWLPRDYLDDVREVQLTWVENADAGLAHLQGLSALQKLLL